MKHILLVSACALTLNACAQLGFNKTETETQAENDIATQNIISQTQAASEVAAAIADNNPTKNQQDDIKVLPETPTPAPQSETKNATEKNHKTNDKNTEKSEKNEKINDKNNPAQLNVTLRNQPKKSEKTDVQAAKKVVKLPQKAAVVNLPPPKPAKPVLTRRQTLEKEINREKAALKSAQNQLAAAQKSGNSKAINKLTSVIRDRELNIRAIEQEMKK